MREAWSGTIFFADGWALYAGPVAATELHAHHAHQIVLGAPPLAMRDAEGARTTRGALVIPAGAPHAIEHAHPGVLVLFADGEGERGRRIAGEDGGHGAASWDARGEALSGLSTEAPRGARSALEAAAAITAALAGAPRRARRHPAITPAVAAIERVLPGPVRAADVAAAVGLSPGRLMHLFRDEVGLSMRGFVRWARMRRALAALERGVTLGAAAHEAGFADAAHLTRTFRATFGLAPSALSQAVRWVLVEDE